MNNVSNIIHTTWLGVLLTDMLPQTTGRTLPLSQRMSTGSSATRFAYLHIFWNILYLSLMVIPVDRTSFFLAIFRLASSTDPANSSPLIITGGLAGVTPFVVGCVSTDVVAGVDVVDVTCVGVLSSFTTTSFFKPTSVSVASLAALGVTSTGSGWAVCVDTA